MTGTNMCAKSRRNIVYVDASSLKGKYKIGLYDKTKGVKKTLALGKSVKNSFEAEKYAILYGLMYIQELPHKSILLNDCEGAVQEKQLMNLAERLETKIIWIPREINKADAVARKTPNTKKRHWKNLFFFMHILLSSDIRNHTVKKQKTIETKQLKTLTPIVKIIYEKMLSETDIFPMTTAVLANMITSIYHEHSMQTVKGYTKKVRKELVDNGLIVIKNNVASLVDGIS